MIARGLGPLLRREIGSFFFSPVGALVGVAFLAVQGLAFWGLVRVLANPAMPAPYGAVLSSYFGGTVVYWALLFALTSALTMRLYAEERRSGTWETLCTTGVRDSVIVVAKVVAAWIVYLSLWVPTLSFVLVVQLFAPEGSGLELGPIMTAYIGVALFGAVLVSVGAFASAMTNKQMVAALISFVVAFAVLLLGEITSVGLSVRHDMGELAAGLLRPKTLVLYGALAVVAQFATYAAVAAGRRPRLEIVRRASLALAVAASLSAVSVLAGRLGSVDTTSSSIHTLEPETVAVLARVSTNVEILIVTPTVPGFADVFEAIAGVLDRFAETQPRLSIITIDPAEQSPDLLKVAKDFGLPPGPLREGGAVVFRAGARRRLLDVTALASFENDPLGAGRMASFWAESAFAQAIAEITDDREHVVCFAQDVGGLATQAEGDDGLDWAAVATLLRRDGVIVRSVATTELFDQRCDALAIVGPSRDVSADASLSINRFIEEGGSMLVAARSETTQSLAMRGLEPVLAQVGLAIGPAVVVDPDAEVGIENVWTVRTYGDHPITRAFTRRGIETVWPAPRVVIADDSTALVMGSEKSWGETDVTSVFSRGEISAAPEELLGRVPVAAAFVRGRSRFVALGSAEAAASQLVARGLGAGHILAARSLRWLVGRDVDVPLAEKTPAHLRLVMSGTAKTATFIVAVIVVPLVWLLFFGLLAWRRRRG